ncbi:MAG: replicative DNA helicase [Succinivibrionaceae bacterium]
MAIDVSSTNYQKIKERTNINAERVQPYSFEAEQALIGGLLLSPHKIDSIVSIVAPDDFYDENLKVIYSCILSLASQNHGVDIISLCSELEKRQKLQTVGGQSRLLTLQSKVPDTVDILSYAQTIVDKSKGRKLLKLCDLIQDSVYRPNGKSIEDIIDLAESSVFKLAEDSIDDNSGPQNISYVISQITNEIRDKNKKVESHGITGISTGYTDLNNYTSGFHGGELIIVAARPAMGKTTFAMNLIQNIAMDPKTPYPTLVFSLEMPSEQIGTRLLASMGRIDHERIKKMQLEDEDIANMLMVVNKLINTKPNAIFIDDTPQLSPMEIRTRARRIVKEYGGISAIMVDYLQLMRVPGYDPNSRHLEVGECSKSLKALAKELNVPVIALAQLNRGLEGRKDKRPMNSDLRESGSIEQDADMILFVHREEVFDQNNPELKGKAEIIIGKQRNGPIGTVNMFFEGNYSKFVGIDSIRSQS